MAFESWDHRVSFLAQANESPWVETGWTDLENNFQINTNGLRPNGFVIASSRYADAFTGSPTVGITIVTNVTAGSDPLGPALWVASGANAGKGYIFWCNGGTGSIRRRDAATGIGSNIGSPTTFTIPTPANGDQFQIDYNPATGDIRAWHNGVLLATVNDTTYQSESFVGGIAASAENNNGRRIGEIGIDGITSASIDTLDATLNVGGTHAITTTGLGTLTTASTVGGKAIASVSAPSGDGTITLAGFVSGQTYPAMGTQSCVMSDGTLTASANRTLDTMDGWQWAAVAGLDTGDWSLGKAFSGGDTPSQLHVIDDGTGVLNADGTLTDWPSSGTFTCWARMAAGGAYSGGEMVSFTFTVTASGLVFGTDNPSLKVDLTRSLCIPLHSRL